MGTPALPAVPSAPNSAVPAPGVVIAPDLRASIDQAVRDVARRGQVTVGASTTGVELSYAQKLAAGLTVGGYAQRMWGGTGWRAAARAAFHW